MASTVTIVAPSPGALGALEAALIAAFQRMGLSPDVAVGSVFLFRAGTFWIPVLPGWVMFEWMKRHGDLWHVRVFDWADDQEDKPYLAVDFVIGQRDGQLEIVKWSITGHQVLATRQSRFPLQTYARAALFAAEDALVADDVLDYEAIMAQELPYLGSLKRGWVYKEFRIADGHIEDPRARKPRRSPRRKNATTKACGRIFARIGKAKRLLGPEPKPGDEAADDECRDVRSECTEYGEHPE